MSQQTPRPADTRSDSVRALAEQYAARHTTLENYALGWFTAFGLLRRLGIDPFSWRGRLATGWLGVNVFLGLPVLITAVTGQWADAPFETWAVTAVYFGAVLASVYGLFQGAVCDLISLHCTMVDESGLQRLIAWDLRWYRIRTTVLVATAFALAVLVPLFFIERGMSGAAVPVGTIVVSALLLYQTGENSYVTFMLGIESRILAAYDYELYRLSPIDSVALRRSIRGYNQLGLLQSLFVTTFIILFAFLLPADSNLIAPIALILLLVAYLAIGFGVLVPRLAFQRLVQAEKEREMAPLQRRMNHLSSRLRELTAEEYAELKRLDEMHNKIRDSSENLLPLATIGQIVGTLLLPTVTTIAAVAGEAYLVRLLGRLVR